jgi:ATP-dependent DNA helicase RecG
MRISKYGSKIKRIINICADYGIIAPKFEEVFSGFRVILFKEKLNDELNDELNEGQKTVYQYIKANRKIQAKNISIGLNMPYGTVDRHIRLLLKKNYIIRIGSKKTGGYIVQTK